MTSSASALLSLPTKPTLYHSMHFSSSRPLGVLMELGIVPFTSNTDEENAKEDSTSSPDTKKPKTQLGEVVVQSVTYEQLKKDPVLTKLNPQKRLPFFHDPEKDISLTESGGLVQYLLETYDPDHDLHPPVGHLTRPDFLQLLHFGPATAYHQTVPILFPPDKAEELDKKKTEWHEIFVPTLERCLTKYGGPYLLGDKLSAVDISLAYDLLTVDSSKSGQELFEAHPTLKAYHDKISTLPFYKAVFPKKG